MIIFSGKITFKINNMDIQDLLNLFNSVVNQEGKSEILPTTEFKELDEWSSLTAFTLVEEIGSKYNIRIRGIELRRCTTIEDLLELLNSK